MATVLLVTSDRDHCGVREYGRMLQQAVMAACPGIVVEELANTSPDAALDRFCCPGWTTDKDGGKGNAPDIVHLNHHAALHSQWKPEHITALQKLGAKVVVTQHDTFEDWAIMRERGFLDATGADLLLVHEKVEGLYGMQGVHWFVQPCPAVSRAGAAGAFANRIPWPKLVVGTAGFRFPWKGHDRLQEAAEKVGGWMVRAFGGEYWGPQPQVIRALAECDVVAFPYSTGNSGTSGAIRLGIASGRPVICTPPTQNRQVRDLYDYADYRACIHWTENLELALEAMKDQRTRDLFAAKSAKLASALSWEQSGAWLAERYLLLGE